jgi:hypothetical protein
MAFLSEHRENDRRVLSKPRPSQMSLRSRGGRCQKSHATSPPAQSIPRWLRLGARCPAPIAAPATRRCEHLAGDLRTRDCSPSEHVPPDGAEVSCRRVLSRAKHSPVSRKYSRSLQALSSRPLEGWVLEWLPALR